MKKFYVCKENDDVFYIESVSWKDAEKEVSEQNAVVLKEENTIEDALRTCDWYDDMISG